MTEFSMDTLLDTPLADLSDPEPLPKGNYRLKLNGAMLPKEGQANIITILGRPIKPYDHDVSDLDPAWKAARVRFQFWMPEDAGKLRRFIEAIGAATATDTTRQGLAKVKGIEVDAFVETTSYTNKQGALVKQNNGRVVKLDEAEDTGIVA